MSNDKITTIVAVVALIVAVAACVFAFTANNEGSTGLYIGEHEVTNEGTLFNNQYGNLEYVKETNTLYVSHSIVDQESAGVRVYDDVLLGVSEDLYDIVGQVGFIISYEGTRPLNIVFIGDVILLGEPGQMDYVGGFYIAKKAVVNVSGPGMLTGVDVNHSLFYGKEAKIMINDVDMNAGDSIDIPLAAKTITVENSNFDFSTEYGYAGLYTSHETVIRDSTIYTTGFDEGVHLTSTCIYDSRIEVDAEVLGFKVYSCRSYDSYLISTSAYAGMYFFDPLYLYGGYLYSSAQELYALYSPDTTLMFHDATIEAYTASGSAIQAWHVEFYDCKVTAKSDAYTGIYGNFNPLMYGLDDPWIIIDNTDVDASGAISAIWSVGQIKIVDSTLKSGCKVLSADTPVEDTIVSAICDSSESELKIEVDEEYVEPLNASKKVQIEATS